MTQRIRDHKAFFVVHRKEGNVTSRRKDAT